jgi:transcriptional regulator GlxA family with amidase domain
LDTVLVAGSEEAVSGHAALEFLNWLRSASERTRGLGSICTGAFYLAHAGLLDGRRATSHWRYLQRLASAFPSTRVEPDPIFVQDGHLHTLAGITAGIDRALAMVEADCGPTMAQTIARDLVVFLQRHGGQAQLSASLVARRSIRRLIRQYTRPPWAEIFSSWVLDGASHATAAVRVAKP